MEAVEKASKPLEPGTMLSRKINFSSKKDQQAALNLKPGQVLVETALSSTSMSENVWSGTVHWKLTAGKGAKGAYVKKISAYSNEGEVLLPANTRYVIKKVQKHTGIVSTGNPIIVEAVIFND